MPRKRATRLNQRAKPKKPDGNIGGDLDPQERREKLSVFLHDFDMEGSFFLFCYYISYLYILYSSA